MRMKENTIQITGVDISVGEVVQYLENDSTIDEQLYQISSIEVYGSGEDWDRLTVADVVVKTKDGITNEDLDTLRYKFLEVDIEVLNDSPVA
jgi:uncharacterized protein (DUF433 family)